MRNEYTKGTTVESAAGGCYDIRDGAQTIARCMGIKANGSAEGNARLFAAAPALLEALKVALQQMRDERPFIHPDDWPFGPAIRKVEEAIAAACEYDAGDDA